MDMCVPLIVLTIEPKIVIIFSMHDPLSFKVCGVLEFVFGATPKYIPLKYRCLRKKKTEQGLSTLVPLFYVMKSSKRKGNKEFYIMIKLKCSLTTWLEVQTIDCTSAKENIGL